MDNQRVDDPSSSLLRAVAEGDAARVATALQDGAAVDFRDDREQTRRMTPLMLATRLARADLIELLIAAGADVNATDDPNGQPPSGLGFVLREAGLEGLNQAKFKLNRTALMFASIAGHPQIVSILLAAGAKVDRKDYAGCTALHLAARHGNSAVIRLLLAAGAKVDQRGPDRRTPLSLAVESGSPDAVRLLLEAHASVTLCDADGHTVLDVAAARGSADVVRILLEAMPEQSDGNQTLSRALTSAISDSRAASEESIVKVAEFLIAAGARPAGLMEDDLLPPLHSATMNGYDRVVAMLLAAGAEADLNDPFSGTALKLAVIFRRLTIARLLLEHGADQHVPDRDGRSPLDYAREHAAADENDRMLMLLAKYARPSGDAR